MLNISETSICNSALIKIGADRIISIDEGSKRSIACKDRLSFCRNEVLAAHNWKFAKKRLQLAALGTTPAFGWSYEYQLPADYLNMVQDPEELDVVRDYVVEGRKLLANDNPVKILYIFEETSYGNWEFLAAEALAWRLAVDIAYLVSQSKEVAALMLQGYQMALKDARYNDSRQQPPRGLLQDTFTNSRL
jgi:hypothetical protein